MATVMAFTISPRLALFFVGTLPVLAVTLAVMLKTGQPRFRRMLVKMDDMNRAVQENLVNSRVVKAFVRGDYESERFDGTAEDLRQAFVGAALHAYRTYPDVHNVDLHRPSPVLRRAGDNIPHDRAAYRRACQHRVIRHSGGIVAHNAFVADNVALPRTGIHEAHKRGI